MFRLCLSTVLTCLFLSTAIADDSSGVLRPGDPAAVDESTERAGELVAADTAEDADEGHLIARVLREQDEKPTGRALRPVQPSTRPVAEEQAHDHIFYVPGEGEPGLLDVVGILGMSEQVAALEDFDLPVRHMESLFAPGIDVGLIGGDSRKTDAVSAEDSIVQPQDPLLEAVLADPVLTGARPRIDALVVEPDRTDAPLRFSDVDSSMGASLAALGDHEGAERLLKSAVLRNMRDHGVVHARTQASLRVLVDFYQSWAAKEPEKSDEADRYRKMLAR